MSAGAPRRGCAPFGGSVVAEWLNEAASVEIQ